MNGARITFLESLPDDPATLKAMIARLAWERDEHALAQQRRIEELEAGQKLLEQRTQDLELSRLRLEMELLRLKKWVYGPRADRLSSTDEVNQMLLEFGRDLEARPIEKDEAAEGAGDPRWRRAM